MLCNLPSLCFRLCPAVQAGERPLTTPLIRYLAERDEREFPTLHHRTLLPEDDRGRTLREVLQDVQFSSEELSAMMRRDVERAVKAGRISLEESRQLLKFYDNGLEGYTYLE